MKKKELLMLSFVLSLTIGSLKASQETGDVIISHSPKLPVVNLKEFNNTNPKNNFILDTNDPYKLDELSDKKFSERKFDEAADLLIASAMHGHNDNKAFLADIDNKSIKYTTSKDTQSSEAINYIKILRSSVIKYLINQSNENYGTNYIHTNNEEFEFGKLIVKD